MQGTDRFGHPLEIRKTYLQKKNAFAAILDPALPAVDGPAGKEVGASGQSLPHQIGSDQRRYFLAWHCDEDRREHASSNPISEHIIASEAVYLLIANKITFEIHLAPAWSNRI
jgi:hypothetical protein